MILHKELTNYSCSIYYKEQLQHTRNHSSYLKNYTLYSELFVK